MKKTVVGLVSTTILTISGPLSAHVGEHGPVGFLADLAHLLVDHGYLLALLGVVAGGLILTRLTCR
ncbi:MAG: hypothetical protein K1563_05010 [Candidatus Thiodiazotropha sp. (ex. Lucinisca nassula)]|uniref:hypothetical protein n=1 Tax=Candidatus Thiodiazotropha sp. LNASS1 TaxID=3096260 RepID=UPI000D3905D8|nr:hypothetical protein [Candidatus Thiodiazotropha sp. (ex. Lucinisca nassula)]MBW9273028.1 hypothetical protein [Candidatus Thiodiazotropha sp. (ex. Lucinisca nassula)]PUB80713.1 MAG: hypothetical protein DBP02_20295 [gamma proteobacterium symbiont of Ctena orbiculata]PUB91244.1 MAG: hypothetical protein DBP01_03385 [gamma proteobacterium symbiont of Ctena orbiculata]